MIYHANLKDMSRARGHSAVAAAAYRSCTKITDTRTGEVHDYRRKRHHQSGGICTPDGSEAPDRAALWNEAEAIELREKSTVAQEWEIALPVELTPDQQAELAKDLAQMIASHVGTVCQYDVHKGHKKPVLSQEEAKENRHVHIMHPTRRWAEGHLLKGRLDRVDDLLSTDDRKAKGLATSRTEDVKAMRERIATVINRHLAAAGIDERVDHRSFAERGIDREPQQHMGKAASAMERRGVRTELGDVNRQIITENKAKAQAEAAQAPAVEFVPPIVEPTVLSDLGIDDEPTIKPRPSSTIKKPTPKNEYKAPKIERPQLPQLPIDISGLVTRDQLEEAALYGFMAPRGPVPYRAYWTQIRALIEPMPGTDPAQRDLLAAAIVDQSNPNDHPADDIKAAIIDRYGDTPEVRAYADKIEAQCRLDKDIIDERLEELEQQHQRPTPKR